MQIGSKVRVLPPFAETFNQEYIIVSITDSTYFLEGIEGGFDISYLEEVL
jgi:hypothetical protein